jgi:hypothetical protein
MREDCPQLEGFETSRNLESRHFETKSEVHTGTAVSGRNSVRDEGGPPARHHRTPALRPGGASPVRQLQSVLRVVSLKANFSPHGHSKLSLARQELSKSRMDQEINKFSTPRREYCSANTAKAGELIIVIGRSLAQDSMCSTGSFCRVLLRKIN